MKKIILTTLFFAPAVLLAQQVNYAIKGNVGTSDAPAKAYLTYRSDTGNITDSASVQQGNFSFKGTIASPVKATLYIAHKGENLRALRHPDAISLYLEPGPISVTGGDSVYHAKINGGQLNQDNQELTAEQSPFTSQLKVLEKAFDALPKEKRTEQAEAGIEKQIAAVEESEKPVLAGFIKAHPNSLVSLDALKLYGGYFPEASNVAPLYNSLTAAVKGSAAGQQYGKWLQGWKLTALGANAPLFTQKDKDGNDVSLASFKGKYVLVDFWASWCGPCRRENPNIVKTFNQFKDKNFTIVGVSLDTRQDAWLNAVKDDGLDWTQVSDLKYWKNAVAELYGVRAIPQNFLLDPDGKIIAKNLNGDQLASKLGEIFGRSITADGTRTGGR